MFVVPFPHLECKSRMSATKLNDDQGRTVSHSGKEFGPQTLSVCKEARKETLRQYIALFEEEPSIPTLFVSLGADAISVEYYYGQFLIGWTKLELT